MPTIDALVITPICPHTLSVRPLVVEGDSVIRIHIASPENPARLSLDGQTDYDVAAGESVEITRAAETARLVRLGTRSFLHVVRTRLGWGSGAGA
jgi:NAD+ kinase